MEEDEYPRNSHHADAFKMTTKTNPTDASASKELLLPLPAGQKLLCRGRCCQCLSYQILIFLIRFTLIRMGKHKTTFLDFFGEYVEEKIMKNKRL